MDGKKRFFIPIDAALGMPVLEKILDRWPVMRANTGDQLNALQRPEAWEQRALARATENYRRYQELHRAADAAWEGTEAALSTGRLAPVTLGGAMRGDNPTWAQQLTAGRSEDARAAAHADWQARYLRPMQEVGREILEQANAVKGKKFSDVDAAYQFLRARYGDALQSRRRDGLTADEQRVQKAVLDKLHAHPEAYLAEYTRRFGNVLNTDDAAKLFPEYNHSIGTRTKYRLAVQPAARWIRDELFRRALQTSGKRVAMFIGGGPGAGKSTLLRENPAIARDSAVVLDAMLSDLPAVKRLVDLATAAGKRVAITYVHRDALQAYRAVLERSVTEGRVPSVDYFLAARAGAARTIRALAQEYADDSKVALEAVENVGERGGQPFRTIDTLPLEDYTQIREHLHELLDAEHAAGRITQAVYRQCRRDDGEGSRSLARRAGGHRPESGGSQGSRQAVSPGERSDGEVTPESSNIPRAVYKHGVVFANPAAIALMNSSNTRGGSWDASTLPIPAALQLQRKLLSSVQGKPYGDPQADAVRDLSRAIAEALGAGVDGPRPSNVIVCDAGGFQRRFGLHYVTRCTTCWLRHCFSVF